MNKNSFKIEYKSTPELLYKRMIKEAELYHAKLNGDMQTGGFVVSVFGFRYKGDYKIEATTATITIKKLPIFISIDKIKLLLQNYVNNENL